MFTLYHGDFNDYLQQIEDESIDLILTDPPYGQFGKNKCENNIIATPEWIVNNITNCISKLKTNGNLYFFVGSFEVASECFNILKSETRLKYNSFLIWDKKEYLAHTWKTENNILRSWFNKCEYILYYNRLHEFQKNWNRTGLEYIYSNPECFLPLKTWYKSELKRLGKTEKELKEFYTQVTGKKPNMFRHYFCNSQFQLPTKEIYNTVFIPFGFRWSHNDIQNEFEDLKMEYDNLLNKYESIRNEYESIRNEYEAQRYYHKSDSHHVSLLSVQPPNSQSSYRHPCKKPTELLRRLIRVSCRPGGTVFDPFSGSGSTGVAAIREDRNYIGCEITEKWYELQKERLNKEINTLFDIPEGKR